MPTWVTLGLIAAAVGFLIGSCPGRDQRGGDVLFNLPGAVIWSFAAFLTVSSLTYCSLSGSTFDGWAAVVIGLALAVVRIYATSTPRKKTFLEDGINRAKGTTKAVKFKTAVRAYKTASFLRKDGNWYAARNPIGFCYNKAGMPAADLRELHGFVTPINQCDVLLLLVRELPGEPDQSAVVVVRGGEKLRALVINDEGVNIPAVAFIQASSIARITSFKWR